MDMKIPFNKPHFTGKEAEYIYEAISKGKLSGNGDFSKRCQSYFENRYGFKKCLLTTSCTDALEMAAILCDIKPGDEVIVPSYTFVSSALAFVREGAKIVFADSMDNNPNIDANKIESLITSKTKVIVPVHYAGVACDMDKIMKLAADNDLIVVEDAAHSIDSYYKEKPLGTIGHLSTFSFHETKNIISGEGGMLAINDERFIRRAEIIWEKGTNRVEFSRGRINKYGWVDVGSSFLPSEITAAFLWAQIENIDAIQQKRNLLWSRYFENLKPLVSQGVKLPNIPETATNNAHMFYLLCNNLEERTALIKVLKDNDILAVFHYLSLHKSPYYKDKHDGRILSNSDKYEKTLVRLPLFYDLSIEEVDEISTIILNFYTKKFG